MSSARSSWPLSVAATLGLVLTSGCADDGPDPPFDDATLFAMAADLDGVTSARLSYTDTLGTTRMYSGLVEVDATADPRCVLYQTAGLLMQGRPGAGTPIVTVVQGTSRTKTADLPFRLWRTLEELAASATATPAIPDCSVVDLGIRSPAAGALP